MKIIRDKSEMRQLAEESKSSSDIFGERCFPTVFFPETATIKEMNDALYWGKGHDALRDYNEDGEKQREIGLMANIRIKAEYLEKLIDELIELGGGFVNE